MLAMKQPAEDMEFVPIRENKLNPIIKSFI
jgi:hypothetical protein